MLSEIQEFEIQHKKEMDQLKSQYELKIAALTSSIEIRQKEFEMKDNIYQEIKNRSSLNENTTDNNTSKFGVILTQFQKQKENEIMKLKKHYQKELIYNQKLLRKKDCIIEQLGNEIMQFKKAQKNGENMDNQKIILLSRLLDLSNEIKCKL